ncbi:MAG TPA: ThiF family adenylyltransferase [Candidatus Bathyarchaeia archaeon]|nr:ThiF family adenylyltransferase [Candidatus Bathyarchaeia archaeon]
MKSTDRERYSRQILFAGIGEGGQEKLLSASAVLVGCGALGTVVGGLLARAGVRRLRIIDRDFVEPSNLQRQTLFDEQDAREALPKAVAAKRHLRAINDGVQVEGIVADLTAKTAVELLSGFPLILDGTDNFETRLLVNDAAISLGVPWIYAAVVGSYGVTMTVRPGESACLACLLEAGDTSNGNGAHFGNEATCDTVGVLGSAASVIGSLEATEALKILAGKPESLHGRVVSCDVWSGRFQSFRFPRNPDCRACGRREFSYLAGEVQPHITMCGRDSVQIHERNRRLNLAELGKRLSAVSAEEVRSNDFLLRFRVSPYELTVFADGRAIIKGTKDPAVARSLYARYLGA